MKKIVFGILVSMLMIGSVFASGTGVNNEEVKTNFFEDSEIVTSITVESYEIEITDEGDYLSANNFGRLLIPSIAPIIPT